MRRGLKVVAVVTIALALFGFLVMTLWNWLMPTLFGRPLITVWQAFGLLALSRILVGGWRRPGPAPWVWRRRWMERWEQMTPDERERFRQGVEGRRGPVGPPTESTL
jgi:hypothetical protein